jgi:hypothetical protein
MAKIDVTKFNNDPAFETERNEFDALFEGGFRRFMEKQKKAKEQNPDPEEGNIFDMIFGPKKGGAE